ncbi:DUF4129 domain-containing protein [Staphylothermus hellenicus]|nr:DUF4129 domain-containing protein [Staphylothermus hellenicus]
MLAKIVLKKIYVWFFLTVFVFMTLISMITYGEVQRNDKYVPTDTYPMDENKLLQQLSLLKQLNDSIVNSYVSEINQSIQNGDYEKAYMLLNELNNYLKTKYNSDLNSNMDLAKTISLIDSIQNLTENGVEVNLTSYLYELGKLLNNESLIQDAYKLRHGEVVNNDLISELINYMKQYKGGVRETSGSETINPRNPLEGGVQENPLVNIFNFPNIGVSNASVFNPPTIPLFNFSKYFNIILYIIMGSLVLAVLYYVRQPIRQYLDILFTKIDEKKMIIKARIGKTTLSRAIMLYYKWYSIAKRHGYRRKPSETPRELLSKIRIEDLRTIGEHVTRIYEENVYGKYEVDEALISKVERELRSLFISKNR